MQERDESDPTALSFFYLFSQNFEHFVKFVEIRPDVGFLANGVNISLLTISFLPRYSFILPCEPISPL